MLEVDWCLPRLGLLDLLQQVGYHQSLVHQFLHLRKVQLLQLHQL